MTNGTTTWSYEYNADGLRTSRSNGTTTYEYIYNGSSLVQMTVGTDTLYFAYDASGTPMSVTYNGTVYYYATNLQGDVIAILDSAGTAVVEYTYDAWGSILTTTGSMASTLGVANPLTYRGYVYDAETSLYYLQSRYYNSQIGRFLNADALVATGQGFVGNNMFAYCNNNPVNFIDSSGEIPDSFAGQAGEDLGRLIYEWLTGDDHPAREAEALNSSIIAKQVEVVTSFLNSDEFESFQESNAVKGMKGLNKIRSGWRSIKKGAGMILAPIPTEAEDISGVAIITYGIIKAVGGIVECVIAIIGG